MRDWLLQHAATDVPLLTLALLMGASIWMLVCASRRPEGMVGKMLQDDAGKPSVLRLIVLWGFIAATWVVMKMAIGQNEALPTLFAIYVAGTFGAHVAVKISEKWSGNLPWSKP